MTNHILTQDELKSQLSYDTKTGIFTRLIAKSNRTKIGNQAGTENVKGYTVISFNNKIYLAHRLAWLYINGQWPKNQIDHINMNRSDNRWCNLRECNNQENMQNTSIKSTNSSGYKGVTFDKYRNKWCAMGRLLGKTKFLGRFDSVEQASEAYKNFAKEHHGEFYREQAC